MDSETRAYSLHKSTGETVYDDRPLRFRHMTPTEADVRALENDTDPAGFKIRISKLRGGQVQAGMLVEKRYSGRGYEIPGFRKERNLHTFIAYDEGRLMGTVGLRLDSRKELSADELYPGELASLRKRQYRLCEFTRLAVDKGGVSRPVLAGLFHTAYLFASVIRGATHAVIEVNPRHVVFYRRSLKFEALGPERLNTHVNAPAVLLYVPFAVIAEGVAKFAGKPDAPGAGHLLFPYFFSAEVEAGLLRRLRERA